MNNPNDVRRGIDSLVGKVKPFMSIAMPLLRKVSPKIAQATGYTVDELYGALNSGTAQEYRPKTNRTDTNIYNKYDNL